VKGSGFYAFDYDLVSLVIRRTNIVEDSPYLLRAIVTNVLRPGFYSEAEAQCLEHYIRETQIEVSFEKCPDNDGWHWYVQETERSVKLRKLEGSYSGIEFVDYNPLTGITTTTTYTEN